MKKFPLLIAVCVMFWSCNVLKPPLTYNQAAIDQITVVSSVVNDLYNTQILASDKTYMGNLEKYNNASAQAEKLKSIDAGRPKALTLDYFIINRIKKYSDEHNEAGTFNTSQFKTRLDQMQTLLKSRALAEPGASELKSRSQNDY